MPYRKSLEYARQWIWIRIVDNIALFRRCIVFTWNESMHSLANRRCTPRTPCAFVHDNAHVTSHETRKFRLRNAYLIYVRVCIFPWHARNFRNALSTQSDTYKGHINVSRDTKHWNTFAIYHTDGIALPHIHRTNKNKRTTEFRVIVNVCVNAVARVYRYKNINDSMRNMRNKSQGGMEKVYVWWCSNI